MFLNRNTLKYLNHGGMKRIDFTDWILEDWYAYTNENVIPFSFVYFKSFYYVYIKMTFFSISCIID